MPTTQSEADQIISIANEYLAPEELYNFCSELWFAVGMHTDNDSLKTSLNMLFRISQVNLDAFVAGKEKSIEDIYEKPADPYVPTTYNYLFKLLVAFHVLVVFGNLLSVFLLTILQPWYVSLPLVTFIIWISTSRVADCPLTRWENKLRLKLGRPEIKGFIGYYFIKPFYRFVARLKVR